MNTVYLVEDVIGGNLIGVFTTKELAEAAIIKIYGEECCLITKVKLNKLFVK